MMRKDCCKRNIGKRVEYVTIQEGRNEGSN